MKDYEFVMPRGGYGMPLNIKFRRGSSEEWKEVNPILRLGEPGFDLDERKIKKGDGVTPWSDLPWFAAIL